MFDVCLLGTGGMMPLPNRWLTACFMRYAGTSLLIDCGEGTQITMRLQGWSFKAIDYILFTHYHGDHISGLPGLLLTIGNSGRTEPVTLIGPRNLRRVVEGLLLIAPDLPFPIQYLELNGDTPVLELKDLVVTPFRADHGMPCFGYSVEIRRKPRFLPEKAKALGIPLPFWKELPKGNTVEHEGAIYEPSMVLGEARRGLKVCYCTDSRPRDSIVNGVKAADLFICEGMYGEEEKQTKAKEYRHMTFQEAATMAKQANVKELWLTHFSPSLITPYQYLDEARRIFPNTKVGKDRLTKVLKFADEENAGVTE